MVCTRLVKYLQLSTINSVIRILDPQYNSKGNPSTPFTPRLFNSLNRFNVSIIRRFDSRFGFVGSRSLTRGIDRKEGGRTLQTRIETVSD